MVLGAGLDGTVIVAGMLNSCVDLGFSHGWSLLILVPDVHILVLADLFVVLLVIRTQPFLSEGITEPVLANPEPVDNVIDPAIAAVGGGHVAGSECGEVTVHVGDIVDAGIHLLLDGQLVDLFRLLCQGLEDDVFHVWLVAHEVLIRMPVGVPDLPAAL